MTESRRLTTTVLSHGGGHDHHGMGRLSGWLLFLGWGGVPRPSEEGAGDYLPVKERLVVRAPAKHGHGPEAIFLALWISSVNDAPTKRPLTRPFAMRFTPPLGCLGLPSTRPTSYRIHYFARWARWS